jgi:hypothetical protein
LKSIFERESVYVEFDNGRKIMIDYDSNKIRLHDDSGNLVMESEIDPILNSDSFKDIQDAIDDAKLNESDLLDHILSSDKIKESIDKIHSLGLKNHTATDHEILTASKQLTHDAIHATLQHKPPSDNAVGSSTVNKVIAKVFGSIK